MENSEDQAVCEATARLIERVRVVVPRFGAGFSGATTSELAKLFGHTCTQLVEQRFESTAKGMALPSGPGEHIILLDAGCKRSDQRFTLRHEFAHILAGEVEEALFLTSEDTLSFSERRADLFAVADLTPTRWMNWVRGKRRPWKHVTLDVVQAYRELTEGWSEQRLWDRARLRVLLYRQHGI